MTSIGMQDLKVFGRMTSIGMQDWMVFGWQTKPIKLLIIFPGGC